MLPGRESTSTEGGPNEMSTRWAKSGCQTHVFTAISDLVRFEKVSLSVNPPLGFLNGLDRPYSSVSISDLQGRWNELRRNGRNGLRASLTICSKARRSIRGKISLRETPARPSPGVTVGGTIQSKTARLMTVLATTSIPVRSGPPGAISFRVFSTLPTIAGTLNCSVGTSSLSTA